MTVIAARFIPDTGRMHVAWDSSVSDNGLVYRERDKVHQLRDGSLVGMAGDAGPCDKVLAALKNGTGLRAALELVHEGELDGMLCTGSEITLFDNSGCVFVHAGHYAAIGSGREVAMGAMYAGANPKTACKAAAFLTTECSEPIREGWYDT